MQEFRKCLQCYLCQGGCHVLREHNLHNPSTGPRVFVNAARLEMNPLDSESRLRDLHGRRQWLLQHDQVLH